MSAESVARTGVSTERWAELVEAARPGLDRAWPASRPGKYPVKESRAAYLAGYVAHAVASDEEVDEYEHLTERMSDLLTRTAAALKGPPGPLSSHDWSDLPAVAARIVAERDEALAELAALRAGGGASR